MPKEEIIGDFILVETDNNLELLQLNDNYEIKDFTKKNIS